MTPTPKSEAAFRAEYDLAGAKYYLADYTVDMPLFQGLAASLFSQRELVKILAIRDNDFRRYRAMVAKTIECAMQEMGDEHTL